MQERAGSACTPRGTRKRRGEKEDRGERVSDAPHSESTSTRRTGAWSKDRPPEEPRLEQQTAGCRLGHTTHRHEPLLTAAGVSVLQLKAAHCLHSKMVLSQREMQRAQPHSCHRADLWLTVLQILLKELRFWFLKTLECP